MYLKLEIYNLLQCLQLEGYRIKHNQTYLHFSTCPRCFLNPKNDCMNGAGRNSRPKEKQTRRQLREFDINETWN